MEAGVTIPDYQAFMRPVLEMFEARGECGIKDLLPELGDHFALSEQERMELLPSGRGTVLASRAHWARTYMAKAGLLESPRRGVHGITDAGRRLLAEHDGPIGNAVLAQFDGFSDWRTSRSEGPPGSSERASGSAGVDTPIASPDEIIASAHAELTDALASDILDLCLSLTPTRFEQLIVDLLVAMGYGGGDERMGRQLGRSGDGGIDEDALGLDAVYVQAKRYAPENTVGRPAIQQFIGSLTGEGATKGVFVTTSSFSAEARDYAGRVMQRVVLIDGQRLARLMIRHGVGVRTRQTYEVRSVDEDYFADPL